MLLFHGLLPSFFANLTRIIHERFCCNRGFAAATAHETLPPHSVASINLPCLFGAAWTSLRTSTISQQTIMNNAG
jgi:hypothetical protein